MVYRDFYSILVPEDNGKQSLDEFYTNNINNMLLAVMAIN